MKDIVDRILKEEEQTRKRVEKVKQEAADILANARKESQDIVEQAVSQAKLMVQKKREESEKGFLSEKETILKEAREKASGLRKSRENDIPNIARTVFDRIIGA